MKLLKICWFVFATIIILLAVIFGGLKAATPILEKHQQQIIDRVNQNISQRITIQHVTIAWYHFSPVIELDDLAVFNNVEQTSPMFIAEKAYIGINFVKLIQHFEIIPTKIIFVHATLNLPPLNLPLAQTNTPGFKLPPRILALHEVGAKSLLVHAIIQNKPVNFITDLNLQKKATHYNMEGDFSFGAEKLQSIFAAVIKLNDHDLTQSLIKLYVESDNVNLAKIQSYLPNFKLPVQGEIASMQAWLVLRNSTIHYVALDLLGENINVNTPQFHLLQSLPYIDGTLIYQLTKGGGQQFAVNHLKFSPDAEGFNALVTRTAQNNFAIAGENIAFNYNQLRQYFDLSPFKIPGIFTTIKPKVTLSNLHLQFDLLENKQISNYRAAINFEELSCKALQKIPGITHLAGKVNITQINNMLSFHTKLIFDNSVLTMPWLFRKAIPINSGQANLYGQQLAGQRWMIQGHGIKLTFPDAAATAALKLFIGGQMPPRLEILANAQGNHFTAQNIYKYLPSGIMPDKVTEWLDQSLQKVGQLSAKLILRGDIDQFPFDHNEGLFLIDANITEAKLKFYPGWPTIEQLAANLIFDDRGMDITVKSAKTANVAIANGKAVIPSMNAETPVILQINAAANGAVSDGLYYYLHSPLAADAETLNKLKTLGDFNLNLGLTIPIANEKDDTVLAQGDASIKNVSIGYQSNALTLNQLNGDVKFKNLDINSEQIQGFLGKKPISLQIKTVKESENDLATQVNMTGEFSIDEINAHLPQALPAFITGASKVVGSLIFDHEDGLSFALQSDLNGIAINLPAPLGKPAKQAGQLSVLVNDNDQTTRQIVAQYQKILQASLFFNITKGDMQFANGVVGVGNNLGALTPPDSGLNVNINLPKLNIDAWQDFLQRSSKNSTEFKPINLNQVTVSLQQINLFGNTLNQFSLAVKPYATSYGLDISSKEINGKITLPKVVNNSNPIKASLDNLTINMANTSTGSSQAFQVSPYFNLDLSCQNFKVNQMQFGKINASSRTTANGLTISGLTISSPNYRLNADLNWLASSKRSSAAGNLKINNSAKMLANLGLPNNFNTNNGNVKFNLNWLGLPFVPDVPSLNGNINVLVNQGSITGLSKSTSAKVGFANLLTILSLQNLPGRLERGMSGNNSRQGFNFDKMQGDLTINSGNLQTQNTFVNGAVAKVSISGRIGLAAKDFDLIMVVVPNLTSSLPVVATIAGGPVAGAVTWVVNKAIGSEVNKISKYTYSIKGSWSNPQVTQQK